MGQCGQQRRSNTTAYLVWHQCRGDSVRLVGKVSCSEVPQVGKDLLWRCGCSSAVCCIERPSSVLSWDNCTSLACPLSTPTPQWSLSTGSQARLPRTHAIALVASSLDPKVIQERMGHRSTQTAMALYAKATQGELESASVVRKNYRPTVDTLSTNT